MFDSSPVTCFVAACVSAAASDSASETPDATYYRAFHAEIALRDFERAEGLYAEAAAASAAAKQTELAAKSLVGQGRCLAVLGRKEAAKKSFDEALDLDPGSAAAKEELARLLAPAETSKRVVERIDQLLEEIGDSSREVSAMSDLQRMGDVAVPTLAARLLEEDVTVVARAAKVLRYIGSRAAFEAVAAALSDSRMLFHTAVVDAQEQMQLSSGSLPLFRALLARPEVELRMRASIWSFEHADPATAAAAFQGLLEDPELSTRTATFRKLLNTETLAALVPTLTRMLDSQDVGQRALAATCISYNVDRIPSDVLDATLGRVKQDRDPRIRGDALSAEARRAMKKDIDLAASFVARMLADNDAGVFTRGVEMLDESAIRTALNDDSHEAIAKAWRRTLADTSLQEPVQRKAFSHLDADWMTEEELIDLFILAGDENRAVTEDMALGARKEFIAAITKRHALEELDVVASAVLPRIRDVAGRLLWFERFEQKVPWNGTLREIERVAARDEAFDVRQALYTSMSKRQLRTSAQARLDESMTEHLAEDLRRADETLAKAILRLVPFSPNPRLVPELRTLVARSTGSLRTAAVAALAAAGGRDTLPELMAELENARKGSTFTLLPAIERIVGLEIVPQLVETANADKSASRVVDWMFPPGVPVTPALVAEFVRRVPREYLSGDDLSKVASSLPLDLLGDLVIHALESPRTDLREAGVHLAGRWHVERATGELVRLLNSADGSIRTAAMESIKKLREYRALRDAVDDQDVDARRAALEKAKALAASQVAEQRVAAALAYGALGDVSAVAPLLDLVQDAEASVRSAATKALEKLQASSNPPATVERAKD